MLTHIKNFYNKWSIQSFVLISLSLQIILILLAPLRKRTGNVFIRFLIWVAYLAADWAAIFALGLISYAQKDTQKLKDHVNILVFWAPFLLLHLGGPDTITAFGPEDISFWKRYLVGFLNQVVTAFIIFQQSFPKNKLWPPTVLLFAAGIIKYAERILALFSVNIDRFLEFLLKEPDRGPYHEQIIEECSLKDEADDERNIKSKTARFAVDQGVLEVRYALWLFRLFSPLVVDIILSFHRCNVSRQFLSQTDPKVAFKVLAIELNFWYEILYTKFSVVHSTRGYSFRFICWYAILAALSTFYSLDKNCFHKIDVIISYTLLFGAVALETIGLFMVLFSDWTAAIIRHSSEDNIWRHAIKRWFRPLLENFLTLKSINWAEEINSMTYLGKARGIVFRRWHERIDTYNLIDYCLKESPKKKPPRFDFFGRIMNYVMEKLVTKDFYDRMKYVSSKPLTKELWDFIFKELKKKSDLADDRDTAKKICLARGDWVLQNSDWSNGSSELMHYIVDIDYDQSLILWHIATELCYHTDTNEDNNRGQESHEGNTNRRELCKILSDYMLYLLVMKPTMMYPVAAIGKKRFHDTCTEAKNIYKKFYRKRGGDQVNKQACEVILELNSTNVECVALNPRTSMLFHACILARELKKLEWQKWNLMSEVWVELLSYAASNCRANAHITQLSKGGELMTFVWLLMAHFRIGNQFLLNTDMEFDQN